MTGMAGPAGCVPSCARGTLHRSMFCVILEKVSISPRAVTASDVAPSTDVPDVRRCRLPSTFELYDASNNAFAGYPITQAGSEIYPALPQGTYTYKITDACGATTLINPIDVPLYQSPTVVVDVNNLCFGAGQAILIGTNNNPLNPICLLLFHPKRTNQSRRGTGN